MAKQRSAERDHVDFEPIQSKIIGQRLDKFVLIGEVIKSAIDQIDAADSQGLLLKNIFFVPHPDVHHDVAWLRIRLTLKSDSHPAMAFVRAFEISSGPRVAKNKKLRVIASDRFQPFEQ